MAQVQALAVEFLDKVLALVETSDLPVMILFGDTSTNAAGSRFGINAVYSTCTHDDAVEQDLISFITGGDTESIGRLGDLKAIERAWKATPNSAELDAIDAAIASVSKELEEIGVEIVDLIDENASVTKGKN